MFDHIEVTYKVFATPYGIEKELNKLDNLPLLSFDTEVNSVYTTDERKEAKELLKCCTEDMHGEDIRLSKLVANSSGLSHPKITKVTHFIFSISRDESIIFICRDMKTELLIWNWLAKYEGKLIVHNVGFDLKIMHDRTGKFPLDYEDTQLLAKCLINNADDWKAKTGLKHLMGQYYDPKWTEIGTYDVVNYKDKNFLRYCAIDGASTFKLWEDLKEFLDED